MNIVLIGTNHRACPIELRERLAFRAEQMPEALSSLRHETGVSEALILSTCNRVEIYAGSQEPQQAISRVSAFLSRHSRIDAQELAPRLYTHADPESVRHLFSVASGLDSMVLGEDEIARQVKHAYELARAHGATGKALNVLFQKALNAAKTVRARTGIGRGCVSVGSVALELVEKVFGSLRTHAVVLVGAGKIGELTLSRLAERGATNVTVLNRSVERAAALAQRFGAHTAGLEELWSRLAEADIVITSTASPELLVTRDRLAELMARRHQRPLCIIDLGVPRNVEPAVGELENVYRFDIDDLQGLLTHHHERRQQAAADSQRILDQKVGHFLAWWQDEAGACGRSSSARAAAP